MTVMSAIRVSDRQFNYKAFIISNMLLWLLLVVENRQNELANAIRLANICTVHILPAQTKFTEIVFVQFFILLCLH